MRRLLRCFSVLLLFVISFPVPSGGADKNEKRKNASSNIEVSTFEAGKDVDVPPEFLERLGRQLPRQLAGTNRFKRVFNHGDAPADPDGPALEMTGTVTEFRSGSRAARYLLGHGAGQGEVVARVKLTETASGRTVLERDVTGKVSSGAFGGLTAGMADQLAKEIARIVKKEPFQER